MFPGAVEKARGNPCLIGGLMWGRWKNRVTFAGMNALRVHPELQTTTLVVLARREGNTREASGSAIDLRCGFFD